MELASFGTLERLIVSSLSAGGKFVLVVVIFISDGVELERFTASKDDFILQNIKKHFSSDWNCSKPSLYDYYIKIITLYFENGVDKYVYLVGLVVQNIR